MTVEEKYEVLDIISEIISKHYQKDKNYLFQDTRRREVSDIKKVFMYMARMYTKYSMDTIGQYFKDRGRLKKHNHATVLYSVTKVEDWISIDKEYAEEINELSNEIKYYIDYERFVKDKTNDIKKNIVKKLYNEYDLKFIEVFSKITDYLYENKELIDFMAEEIDEIADETINKMEYEGLYKITQKDLGLGVV